MREIGRRRFLRRLAAAAATLSAGPDIVRAQTYPARPVRIVVGFAAGGVTDTVARLVGQKLSDRLGQQFVVENRTGAGTNIATESVANAPPDGHTLLLGTSANAINATLYDRLSFNFIRDLAPVAGIADAPFAMVVNPAFPAQSLSQFIAYAKANPNTINMASAGIGSPSHVAGELFSMMAGINLTHVPYRGAAPATADLVAGQVQVLFSDITSSIAYILAGRLKALAATAARPLDLLPGVPAVADVLPGFEASSWQGLCAPAATPAAVIDRLNGEINAILAIREIKALVTSLGLRTLSGSPADFRRLIAEDTEKWARVIRFAGIKAD